MNDGFHFEKAGTIKGVRGLKELLVQEDGSKVNTLAVSAAP